MRMYNFNTRSVLNIMQCVKLQKYKIHIDYQYREQYFFSIVRLNSGKARI